MQWSVRKEGVGTVKRGYTKWPKQNTNKTVPETENLLQFD